MGRELSNLVFKSSMYKQKRIWQKKKKIRETLRSHRNFSNSDLPVICRDHSHQQTIVTVTERCVWKGYWQSHERAHHSVNAGQAWKSWTLPGEMQKASFTFHTTSEHVREKLERSLGEWLKGKQDEVNTHAGSRYVDLEKTPVSTADQRWPWGKHRDQVLDYWGTGLKGTEIRRERERERKGRKRGKE